MAEPEYDKEQLRILRNAFKAFDADETGIIQYADLQKILEILGQKLVDKEVKALITEVDKSNSGKLNFSQFCRLAARFVEVEEDGGLLQSELKEAFRVYDKEGKGYLTVQTLRDILHELDDKLSKEDLDMIIEEIDADGSGTVDFDEFMQVMTGKNFSDIIVQRSFVFEPSALVSPSPSSSTPSVLSPSHSPLCPCSQISRRRRLHKRIEEHFERLFEQMLKPFDWHPRSPACSASCVNEPDRPPVTAAALKKHSACLAPDVKASTTTTRTTTTTASSTLSLLTPSRCCYRPVFRPRFPKWVPILTLYREVVQNPFRRRGRMMICYD